MSLGLTTIRTRGRAEKTPPVLASGLLTPAQVAEQAERGEVIKPTPLQRLSSRHKAIARQLASGASTSTVAAMFGMTSSRISILKSDPSFKELLTYWENKKDELAEQYFINENLNALNADALSTLQDRLEDDPASFETPELVRIVQIASDRTGHAPKRVEEKNINVNFGDKLEAARERAREMVIEGTINQSEPAE